MQAAALYAITAIVFFGLDFFFAFEGALKFFAFYAHMDMHRVFNFKTNGYVLFFRKSGVMDMVIATASLLFARRRTGDWIRLFRVLLISSFALEEVPHLEEQNGIRMFGLDGVILLHQGGVHGIFCCGQVKKLSPKNTAYGP